MSGREVVERVSFYKRSDNAIILNNTEKLSEGAKLLSDYFWIFTAHGRSTDHQIYRNEIASFYTCKIPNILELRDRGFDVDRVYIQADVTDEYFYDQRNQAIDLSLFPAQKVIYIYVKGKEAGVYFAKSKVLIASDWTHSHNCIRTLQQMMPYLCKIFKKRYSQMPKLKIYSKVMFGADPEFEVIDSSSRVVSASGVIKGGADPRQEIGRDGAGSQVEIRPAPSSDLRKFISNVRNILKRFAAEYHGYRLSAQGDTYPLGGHVHLSVPPNKDIINLLDNWIGRYVMNLSGNARGSYKRLSAYETKPWGFEYRTPPAAIFLKPQVLYAVLKIIKAVLKGYFSCEGVSLYPTQEEIARLKIEKEWEVLNRFVNECPKMNKDVLKQWRIKVKVEPSLELIFRDDWDERVKDFVRALFSEKVSRKLKKKLNEKGIYRVILFGFKKERGLVCNFKSKIFERIDFNYSVENEEVAFGLPYNVRVNELSEELKKKWLVIVDEIIEELKKN